MKQFTEEKITIHELVNEVFEPREQVNEMQANLLEQAFILACGDEGQPHVGTGAGGSQSDLPWKDKESGRKVECNDKNALSHSFDECSVEKDVVASNGLVLKLL